jgi:hypothetical protein
MPVSEIRFDGIAATLCPIQAEGPRGGGGTAARSAERRLTEQCIWAPLADATSRRSPSSPRCGSPAPAKDALTDWLAPFS